MDPEASVDQPHDNPSAPNHHSRTHIRVTSDADPIPADNKNVLLYVLNVTVPVAISFPIVPLLPLHAIVISDTTIHASSDNMNYPPPPPPPMNEDVRPYVTYVLPPYVLRGMIMGVDGFPCPCAVDLDHPASASVRNSGKMVTKLRVGHVVGVRIYNS